MGHTVSRGGDRVAKACSIQPAESLRGPLMSRLVAVKRCGLRSVYFMGVLGDGQSVCPAHSLAEQKMKAFQAAFGKRRDCHQLPRVPMLLLLQGSEAPGLAKVPAPLPGEQARCVAARLLPGQWVRVFRVHSAAEQQGRMLG